MEKESTSFINSCAAEKSMQLLCIKPVLMAKAEGNNILYEK